MIKERRTAHPDRQSQAQPCCSDAGSVLGSMSMRLSGLAAPAGDVSTAFNVKTIHSFSNCGDEYRSAGLARGADGSCYGTTELGGAHGCGSVFRIAPDGVFTLLHSFKVSDGASPRAGLVPGLDGCLYGTTDSGGIGGFGTVFRITTEGRLTSLHSFGGPDGKHPEAALVQAADGNFYGTTGYGGAYNEGTVFRITPEGVLTTLHSFEASEGPHTFAVLLQWRDARSRVANAAQDPHRRRDRQTVPAA